MLSCIVRGAGGASRTHQPGDDTGTLHVSLHDDSPAGKSAPPASALPSHRVKLVAGAGASAAARQLEDAHGVRDVLRRAKAQECRRGGQLYHSHPAGGSVAPRVGQMTPGSVDTGQEPQKCRPSRVISFAAALTSDAAPLERPSNVKGEGQPGSATREASGCHAERRSWAHSHAAHSPTRHACARQQRKGQVGQKRAAMQQAGGGPFRSPAIGPVLSLPSTAQSRFVCLKTVCHTDSGRVSVSASLKPAATAFPARR
jgi:hypothetical protein